MQYLGMRYSQQNMYVASHIICLWATSIEIMDRWHTTLRPYQEYFSHTGRCEDEIMKGWLQLNKLPPPVGFKPGPLGQQANAKPTELPELFHNNQ